MLPNAEKFHCKFDKWAGLSLADLWIMTIPLFKDNICSLLVLCDKYASYWSFHIPLFLDFIFTFWFTRTLIHKLLVQICPGVWYFGLFNGIGPTRTQSKMVIIWHIDLNPFITYYVSALMFCTFIISMSFNFVP